MVTVTFTVPVPAGEVAVTSVADTPFTLVAEAVPKCTAVGLLKLVPVMVTEVPPAAGPEVGLIEVIVGAVEVEEVTVSGALASMQAAPLGAVVPDGQFVPFPLSKPSRLDSKTSRLYVPAGVDDGTVTDPEIVGHAVIEPVSLDVLKL